jgi:N-acetylglucosaminyldiphosphoundecaprenol N-acetyl-beta-D-mannosaminyltransferase
MSHTLKTTTLFDLPIVAEPFAKVLETISAHEGSKPLIVCTPNPEQVVLSAENQDFKQDLLQADLLLPDGIGLVLASKVFAAAGKSNPIAERITGIDIVIGLLKHAYTKNKKVLVIGGRNYGAEFAGSNLEGLKKLSLSKEFFPEIHAHADEHNWYWMEGYSVVGEPTESEQKSVAQVVKKLQPDYVFVAFGAPFQEKWLVTHQSLLAESGTQVAMAVGGTFDVLTGNLSRAPQAFKDVHLEWLYRLIQEPWRWRRQTKLLLFIKGAVQELLK